MRETRRNIYVRAAGYAVRIFVVLTLSTAMVAWDFPWLSQRARGDNDFKKGDYSRAIGHYTKAVENTAGDDWELLYNLGTSYYKSGEWEKAVDNLSAASSLAEQQNVPNLERAKILHNLALSYLQMGDCENAVPTFEQAVELDKADEDIATNAAFAEQYCAEEGGQDSEKKEGEQQEEDSGNEQSDQQGQADEGESNDESDAQTDSSCEEGEQQGNSGQTDKEVNPDEQQGSGEEQGGESDAESQDNQNSEEQGEGDRQNQDEQSGQGDRQQDESEQAGDESNQNPDEQGDQQGGQGNNDENQDRGNQDRNGSQGGDDQGGEDGQGGSNPDENSDTGQGSGNAEERGELSDIPNDGLPLSDAQVDQLLRMMTQRERQNAPYYFNNNLGDGSTLDQESMYDLFMRLFLGVPTDESIEEPEDGIDW